MKRYQSTLTKMTRPVCMALAALLMVGAMASCSENENTETAQSDNAYLSLSFSTSTGNSTRAGESHMEDVLANNESKADPNSESDFHSIKVWVFQSGTNEDANPIAYKEEALKDINGSYNLQLRFLRKIAGKEVENIDLYILANSESTNIESKLSGKDFSSITRKELQNISFDSTFGIQEMVIHRTQKFLKQVSLSLVPSPTFCRETCWNNRSRGRDQRHQDSSGACRFETPFLLCTQNGHRKCKSYQYRGGRKHHSYRQLHLP